MVFYVIMGVSGCGKSTIGLRLANQLNIPFQDADDFHTSDSKRKMSEGVALTDEDRLPWLLAIHEHIKSFVNSDQEGIVACSALKKKYRTVLLHGSSVKGTTLTVDDILFIYLKGSQSLIMDRLSKRTNHFMPVDLLDSQLATLEEPYDGEHHVVVNVDKDVEDIIHELSNILRH